jgi:hypothetical protein
MMETVNSAKLQVNKMNKAKTAMALTAVVLTLSSVSIGGEAEWLCWGELLPGPGL